MTRLVAGCAPALVRISHVVMFVINVADPRERMGPMIGKRKAVQAAAPESDKRIGGVDPFVVRGGLLGLLAEGLALLRAIDPAEANACGVLVVQDFDGVAIEDRDHFSLKR